MFYSRKHATLKFEKNIVLKLHKRRKKMKKIYSRFTLRTSKELLNKMEYISNYYGRTKNKEIEQLIKKHVKEFENIYGEIKEDI